MICVIILAILFVALRINALSDPVPPPIKEKCVLHRWIIDENGNYFCGMCSFVAGIQQGEDNDE